MLEEVFYYYKNIYKDILDEFYPSLNSTGFQERNLTVNFSKAFDKTYANKKVVSWFELQFGENKNNHFDCVIITEQDIYFIESKRFSNPNAKTKSVKNDIDRIINYVKEDFKKDKRFLKYQNHHLYGVILADIWKETNSKKKIYKEYEDKTFFHQFGLKDGIYNVIDFDITEAGYSLLSFIWNVKK